MGSCKQLTDKGLLQILQLCGSTLKSLNIGCTNITGENLSEYKGTLPCLTNLNLRSCKQLTDKGLLQILKYCGSTLELLVFAGSIRISKTLELKIQREYSHIQLKQS